jgi:hypothetical protein
MIPRQRKLYRRRAVIGWHELEPTRTPTTRERQPWPWSATLSEAVARASLPNLTERILTTYLETQQQRRTTEVCSDLMAGLLWESLPDFAQSQGLTIHGEFTVDNDPSQVATSTSYRLIEHSNDIWLFSPLDAIMAFEHTSGQRIMLLTNSIRKSEPLVIEIAVVTTMVGPLEPSQWLHDWCEYTRNHHRLRGCAINSNGTQLHDERPPSWQDIFLTDKQRAALERQLKLLQTDGQTLEQLGIRRQRAVFLHGRPGTGKSYLCRLLATLPGISLMRITPSDLENNSVSALFRTARFLAPTVMFFDDIDDLAMDRDAERRNSKLNSILRQLDRDEYSHDVLVIIAARSPTKLAAPLRDRPERFDQVIELEDLDDSQRQGLLKAYFATCQLANEDLEWLIAQTRGFTGGELRALRDRVLLTTLDHQQASPTTSLKIDRDTLHDALSRYTEESKKSYAGFLR